MKEYTKYVLFGGGVMAERIFTQLKREGKELIGVVDLLNESERKIKEFHEFTICSPNEYFEILKDENAVMIVAVGGIGVDSVVSKLLEKYPQFESKLCVVQPYTSLRFFYVDEFLSKEIRIPFNDERYDKIKKLFIDEESKKLLDCLINSKPYESKEDDYEIVPYQEIKEMYYWEEDYWKSYEFKNTSYEEATVLDCGAYIGDSVEQICGSIPESKIFYYAFEPLQENADQISNNEKLSSLCEELIVLPYGVGEENCKIGFVLPDCGDKEGGKFVQDRNDQEGALEVKKIDDLNLSVKGQLYIKMDIEGSELAALKGAEKMLLKYRPFLAICLYHKKNDLLEIPEYLCGLLQDYKFYLRGGYHTILWAIPQ